MVLSTENIHTPLTGGSLVWTFSPLFNVATEKLP